MNRTALTAISLIACLAFSSLSHGKKYYKYQDEQGIWHYSSKKPDTTQEVEVRKVKTDPDHKVKLIKRGNDQQPKYHFLNQFHGPVEVTVWHQNSWNIQTEPRLPQTFTLDEYGEFELFNIQVLRADLGWELNLKWQYLPGDSQHQANRQTHYALPFENSESFQVSQGFQGRFSHQNLANQYAIDIAMPVDTPILAARSGQVMDIEADFFSGGTRDYYLDRANQVRVLHEDGSMAIYAHLAFESIQVFKGQSIHQGQLIAHSGNTGFSSGPHLHFVIQVNTGTHIESIPFLFQTPSGPITPQAGMILGKK